MRVKLKEKDGFKEYGEIIERKREREEAVSDCFLFREMLLLNSKLIFKIMTKTKELLLLSFYKTKTEIVF